MKIVVMQETTLDCIKSMSAALKDAEHALDESLKNIRHESFTAGTKLGVELGMQLGRRFGKEIDKNLGRDLKMGKDWNNYSNALHNYFSEVLGDVIDWDRLFEEQRLELDHLLIARRFAHAVHLVTDDELFNILIEADRAGDCLMGAFNDEKWVSLCDEFGIGSSKQRFSPTYKSDEDYGDESSGIHL